MKELIVEISDLVPETVHIALEADLTISADLEREIRRSAAQFGYYAVLAEKAESRYRRCKVAFQMWQSGAEHAVTEAARREGVKLGSRVKDLTREVMRLPKWRAYMDKLDLYEEQAGILKVVAKAFEHKKDLVQTCAADRRSELRGS